jgi:hypothetical protein
MKLETRRNLSVGIAFAALVLALSLSVVGCEPACEKQARLECAGVASEGDCLGERLYRCRHRN